MTIFKLSLILVIFFSFSESSYCQEADSTAREEKTAVYDFLIINGRYQSAFTFLGRDFGQTIPFGSLDIMYFLNSGIYFNLSSFKFLRTDIPLQYGVTLGYFKEISKKTDINLSYSQFIVNQSSGITGIENLGFSRPLVWIGASCIQPFSLRFFSMKKMIILRKSSFTLFRNRPKVIQEVYSFFRTKIFNGRYQQVLPSRV